MVIIDYMGIPEVSGVYVLFNRARCIYVGSSVNLRRRVMSQRMYYHFTRVEIFPLEAALLCEKEQEFIDLLRPSENKQRKGNLRGCDKRFDRIAVSMVAIRAAGK